MVPRTGSIWSQTREHHAPSLAENTNRESAPVQDVGVFNMAAPLPIEAGLLNVETLRSREYPNFPSAADCTD